MDDWTGTGAPPAMPILGLIPSNDPKEPSGQLLTRLAHVRELMQPTWDAILKSLSMARGQ
jgi:hypothetical protein